MKVILICKSCQMTEPKKFEATMYPFGNEEQRVTIYSDAPLVPGNQYDLLIKGVFPGSNVDRPCVSDILGIDCRVPLVATSYAEEYKDK